MQDELEMLLVHGLLHLVGYDHDTRLNWEKMEPNAGRYIRKNKQSIERKYSIRCVKKLIRIAKDLDEKKAKPRVMLFLFYSDLL